jgi:ribonuclease HI
LAWVKSKKIKTTLAYTETTKELLAKVQDAIVWLKTHQFSVKLVKWETEIWGEIPADFGRK